MEEFNDEAAAYHLFLPVARDETATLTEWIDVEPVPSPAPEMEPSVALAASRPEPAFKPLPTFTPLANSERPAGARSRRRRNLSPATASAVEGLPPGGPAEKAVARSPLTRSLLAD